MRWGYVVGPLTVLPLLGGLFLIPQPEDHSGTPRFERGRLSVLECHIQAAAFFAFTQDDSAAAMVTDGAAPVPVRR